MTIPPLAVEETGILICYGWCVAGSVSRCVTRSVFRSEIMEFISLVIKGQLGVNWGYS